MPIFEADEELTPEEMKRQQLALTDKIFRLQSKEFMENLDTPLHNGGDCWEDE